MSAKNKSEETFEALFTSIGRRVTHDDAAPRKSPGPCVPAARTDAAHYNANVNKMPADRYARPGVNHADLRKLRKGLMPKESRIDLHGLVLRQAILELDCFVQKCIAQDLRCILVIFGKGKLSVNGPVLKPNVLDWLKRQEKVLAYEMAKPGDGGDGAAYVLLKRQHGNQPQLR